jgi:nucleotide-binding universal stress UspA family protein
MYTSIVVAVDPLGSGDRALPIAASLARRASIELQLALVIELGRDPRRDVWELTRRAHRHGIDAWTPVVLADPDPGRALTRHVTSQPDTLLVMTCNFTGPIAQRRFDTVGDTVLAGLHTPLLLVGPLVPQSWDLGSATLVAGVDSSPLAERMIPAISEWNETFTGGHPWLVEVLPAGAPVLVGAAGESGHVHRWADRLTACGVPVEFEVVHGDPVRALVDVSSAVGASVLAAPSAASADGTPDWLSTTRQLVRDAPLPVLVVPVHEG